MPDDFDPDERFSLYPEKGEDGLKKLLGAEEVPVDEDDSSEDEGT